MAEKKELIRQFPELHRQPKATTDNGKLRLGDGIISDDFPV